MQWRRLHGEWWVTIPGAIENSGDVALGDVVSGHGRVGLGLSSDLGDLGGFLQPQ